MASLWLYLVTFVMNCIECGLQINAHSICEVSLACGCGFDVVELQRLSDWYLPIETVLGLLWTLTLYHLQLLSVE
jgi:hypothetical protein